MDSSSSAQNEESNNILKRGSGATTNGDANGSAIVTEQRDAKRVKMDEEPRPAENGAGVTRKERIKGVAPIKDEHLVKFEKGNESQKNDDQNADVDDDAAEGRTALDSRDQGSGGRRGKKEKKRGQNTDRHFGTSKDALPLCNSRTLAPEFSPRECKFGDQCKSVHDLRRYLAEGRREDLDTLGGKCPVFEAHGRCPSGWRCRFVKSHMKEVEHPDGRKELVLVEGPARETSNGEAKDAGSLGIVNAISYEDRISFAKKRVKFDKSEPYLEWIVKDGELSNKRFQKANEDDANWKANQFDDYRAKYIEPPLKPSEKRKIYFGRETPVLAPLTTQGNLPFRRLCVELGAQVTYSEMALGMPLLQGAAPDWALLKAHESEMTPPKFDPGPTIVQDSYANSKDFKFGAQIAANNPAVALRTTEAITRFIPRLRVIDLNCGCPIDMLYKSGAGSGLLDAPGKLERMIRGMNAVSGEIPITCKIRMGTKDDRPTALKLVERLALGTYGVREVTGPPGCAAITLHGRSRQQRYTKVADWGYIAECSALLESFRTKEDELADTATEPEANLLPSAGKIYFLGNGDCFTHIDYFDHLDNAKVDSVMIGRGAIIKPWIFEEIEKGQYLDKSATERLAYIEKFARYGLETWGSDEHGIGITRRFLLDFMSFFYRYVPIGLLEYLPPHMNDRPPAFRGRNELETLLASKNYKDWIKISDMFLGPAHKDFKFQPKHKSNSFEIEAEG